MANIKIRNKIKKQTEEIGLSPSSSFYMPSGIFVLVMHLIFLKDAPARAVDFYARLSRAQYGFPLHLSISSSQHFPWVE